MRIKKSAVVLGAAVLVFSLHSGSQSKPAQEPSVELPEALARVLTDYEAAWRSRDAEALSGLFAEDGFVLPNGNPPVKGRAAIKTFYSSSGGDLSLRALAFGAEGSVGYIICAFSRQKGEPDIGKYTLTLRKEATGHWMIVSDMDNGNQRPVRSQSWAR